MSVGIHLEVLMEIIKIGYNSFKIALNAIEALEYDFASVEEYDKGKMKGSLNELLDRVETEGELNIDRDRLCAEVYISKDGGCEIFVSRAIKANQDGGRQKNDARAIYQMNSIKNVLELCSRANSIKSGLNAKLYHSKKNEKYYLVVGANTKELKYSFFSEYGERVPNNMLFYIEEHCRCVCEKNAIEILSKLL